MPRSLATLLQHPAIRLGSGVALRAHPTQSSGFPQLDAVLPHGGWPLGAVSELLLPQPGSGELTLLLPLLASLTGQGRRVYLLQPPALPYAPAWAAAGVNLQQVYWLALHDERQGLWSGEQILREPGNAWLGWFDKAPTDKSCRRLQLAAEQGGGLGLLLRQAQPAGGGTPFGLRLALTPAPSGVRVRILKRRGPPLESPILINRPAEAVKQGWQPAGAVSPADRAATVPAED